MNLSPFFQESFAFIDRLPFRYRPWIFSVAATMAGLMVSIFYFQTDFKAAAYAETESVFVKWEAAPEDSALFQKMKKALHKIPSLEKKYEPRIVNKLIEIGKGVEALEMAQHSLQSIELEAPFHAVFAQSSLLIEQKNYQKALEMSVTLKEKIAREENVEKFSEELLVGGAVLYAQNLLRIACLHQELKNKPGEMAAWEELEAFLHLNENSAVNHLFLKNFQEKGLNLFDYIMDRKKHL